jgi:hypothetical protein
MAEIRFLKSRANYRKRKKEIVAKVLHIFILMLGSSQPSTVLKLIRYFHQLFI